MKVEIRRLYSIEIEGPMADYHPLDAENFGTWIRFSVGPADQPGSENFEFFVCTPEWLSENLEEDSGMRWGRHMLIVGKYDLVKINSELSELVGRCMANDWPTTALRIARFAAWEYEDYKT